MTECPLVPTVSWAQRKDVVYLKVKVPEYSKPQIQITQDSLKLSCSNGEGKIYKLDLQFLKQVDPGRSKHAKIGNHMEITIRKLDCEASYWPRLVTSQDKQHWLRVDFNRWKDEDESESEQENEDNDEDLEERMTKLHCDDVKPEPQPVKELSDDPSSWSLGLTSSQQQEWLVDCYRLRVDDEYAWGGNIRSGSLYGVCTGDTTARDLVQDFLLFCRLVKEQQFLPGLWCWTEFLTVAGRLLPYAFEKSDAKEKYGSENWFQAVLGGRSLRYTGERIYGTSISADEVSELYSKLREELLHKKRTPAMIKGMAGIKEWNALEREVSKQLKKMYG